MSGLALGGYGPLDEWLTDTQLLEWLLGQLRQGLLSYEDGFLLLNTYRLHDTAQPTPKLALLAAFHAAEAARQRPKEPT